MESMVGVILHVSDDPSDSIIKVLTETSGLTLPDIFPAKPCAPRSKPGKQQKTDAAEDPGTLRHKNIVRLLGPAMSAYNRWLGGCHGVMPWTSETRVEGSGRGQEADVSGFKTPGDTSQAQTRTLSLDWIDVYSRRHVSRPKIAITTTCSCIVPVPSPALLHAMASQGWSRGDDFVQDLFGAIVASPLMCCPTRAHIQTFQPGYDPPTPSSPQTPPISTVMLPPASRFLMSHGVETLGPLLQARSRWFRIKQ